MKHARKSRRGGALILALVTLLVVMIVAGTLARSLVAALRQTRHAQQEVQAQWLAEAALARGLARLEHETDFAGETWRPSITAEQTSAAEIRIERNADTVKLVVEAHFPDEPWQRTSVRREHVVVQPAAPAGEAQP
jgi:type II secretory pathway component PulK